MREKEKKSEQVSSQSPTSRQISIGLSRTISKMNSRCLEKSQTECPPFVDKVKLMRHERRTNVNYRHADDDDDDDEEDIYVILDEN